MEKQFFKFIIPSMLTMLLTGFYTIVDGFFIGRSVGDVGLAGIGLVWPVPAVLIALGMGIGVGGSVLMSMYRGAGDHKRADRARANTILLLVAASMIVTAVLLVSYKEIVRVLGAKGEVYDASVAYIRIITWGGSMQIIASGLIPIIRNSRQTVQAMLIMSCGLIANIILDACFTMIIPWGLWGVALATIMGQALTVILSVICLWRQKEHRIKRTDFKPDRDLMVKMIGIGSSPFGLSLMPSLITVFNNWQCLVYGGDLAVSAYSVANYYIASVLLLMQGIGEGIQPLISYGKGAGDDQMMRKIRKKGIAAEIILSLVFLVLAFPVSRLLPELFGVSEETKNIMYTALPILCISFPALGLGKLFISYFYACGETLFSSLLVYADPILFTPVCIVVLPRIWKLRGVWLSLPGAQAMVMILLAVLFCIYIRRERRGE